ncbi:MAG: RNA polymerase sigma factor [Phycisphaerae bacterium]
MFADDQHILRDQIDELYRSEGRRVFATLVRLVGDFDLAEEALHEAFAAAVEQWGKSGIPAKPRAWLVSAGRFKAIDVVRRRARFDASTRELAQTLQTQADDPSDLDDAHFRDDPLRLIFTCCHPALAPNVQVALTLREVCGLTTEEIARAFLSQAPTIAQRIVRGKAKIRDAGIPYEIPGVHELPARLDAVLAVIYLVFNEGYSASFGDAAIRGDLTEEAIRLGRVLIDLLPDPEAIGLLALMLLHESRRTARTTAAGDLILLEDQDRSLWNAALIAEGAGLVERALSTRDYEIYTIQAAISAVHASAPTAQETDWDQIVTLYDVLFEAEASPIIELNRAVAIAMRDGPARGLQIVEALLNRGELTDYHLAHAACGDLHRRIGNTSAALSAYERALSLAKQEPERRFLTRRIQELSSKNS